MNATVTSLEDRTRELRRRGLGAWSSEQFLRLLFPNALGLLMIALSTYETAQTAAMRDELGWLNLGVAGLAIAAIGNATWLLRGRESIAFARVALLPGAEAVAERMDPLRPSANSEADHAACDPGIEDADSVFATADGLARYHRADCPFIAGRHIDVERRGVLEQHGLLRCEVCEP